MPFRGHVGQTMAATGYNGTSRMRAPFANQMPGALHVPDPYCFRCFYRQTPDTCGMWCVDRIEDFITYAGSGSVAAMIIEPISGVGGNIVPPPGYFKRLKEFCEEREIILIFDENQTGLGRTGRLFAADYFGVTPHIMTLSKGLTGSGLPLAAILTEERLVGMPRSMHGFTYGGHTLSAAAAVATLNEVRRPEFLAGVRASGAVLLERLRALRADFPCVGDVRGVGLMLGVELVEPDGARSQPAGHRAQQGARRPPGDHACLRARPGQRDRTAPAAGAVGRGRQPGRGPVRRGAGDALTPSPDAARRTEPLSVELTRRGAAALPRAPVGARTPPTPYWSSPRWSAICRSDLKEIGGRRPGPSQFGHELVGVVTRSSTPLLPVGSRVCLDPNVPLRRGTGFARWMWAGGEAAPLARALPLAPDGDRRTAAGVRRAARVRRALPHHGRRHLGRHGLARPVGVRAGRRDGRRPHRPHGRGAGARALIVNRDADRLDFLAARRMLPAGGGDAPAWASGGHDVVVVATSFVLPPLLERALELVRRDGLVMLYGGTAAGDRLPGLACDLDRVRRAERVSAATWGTKPVLVGGSYGTTSADFSRALPSCPTRPGRPGRRAPHHRRGRRCPSCPPCSTACPPTANSARS